MIDNQTGDDFSSLERLRLELELKRESVRELELKCELERMELENLREISAACPNVPADPPQYVYREEFPPPDFATFYVEVDRAHDHTPLDETELFTVAACNRAGVVGEVWYRTSPNRAMALAEWIVSNHPRCEGIINRIDASYH
ncbi:hypothetical protein [Roseibium sp. MMSF_3544]|uniref:hypothetical protein n=1 Tax=unclassified Roseibium TaxID=2629323 RepID=UPI00273E2655|nr:hypothetical protein [Roseibium sp. MMSF_3544]